MKRRQQGKLGVDTWMAFILVLVSCSALLGFLLFGRGSRENWREVQLRAQLNAMNAGVKLTAYELDDYPPSEANDSTGRPYCGVMKLTEALMGQDLRGFHIRSAYRADGLDPNSLVPLYPPEPGAANLQLRKGPFLHAENANAWRLVDIYGKGNTGSFAEDTFVLCDPYARMRPSGEKTGMPILYYRADSSGTAHDVLNPDNPQNIYHYRDNHALVLLGVPGQPGAEHPLADPKRFYLNMQDRQTSTPYRRYSFILISAGQDGLYGTVDDICNFEWKYCKH
jgi:hypothetical protein